ncbi:MAG: HypC/HybG/HupF family hydrogenase formation chaperone [Thermoplasmata archaeon]
MATPGRILEVTADDPMFPIARVDFGGVTKAAQLVYVPEARVGDYVIVQAGFAIRKVGAAEAEECLRSARELAELGRSGDRSTETRIAPAPGAAIARAPPAGSPPPSHRSWDKADRPPAEADDR